MTLASVWGFLFAVGGGVFIPVFSGSSMPWLLLILLYTAGTRDPNHFGSLPRWKPLYTPQCSSASFWRTGSDNRSDCSGRLGEGVTSAGTMLLPLSFCMRAGFFFGDPDRLQVFRDICRFDDEFGAAMLCVLCLRQCPELDTMD